MIRFSKNKIGLDIVILRNLHDLYVIYELIQEMTNLFPEYGFECYKETQRGRMVDGMGKRDSGWG